jgi:hypothetical protein
MVEREKSEVERQLVKQAYDQELESVRKEPQRCQLDGMPPDKWPGEATLVLPPPRGISTALGGKIISAINAFTISRRFNDEVVAKAKVRELEEQLRLLMDRLEQYRQKVAELEARQRH